MQVSGQVVLASDEPPCEADLVVCQVVSLHGRVTFESPCEADAVVCIGDDSTSLSGQVVLASDERPCEPDTVVCQVESLHGRDQAWWRCTTLKKEGGTWSL